MRLALISLLMMPLALGCDEDEEKRDTGEDADPNPDTDADDTGSTDTGIPEAVAPLPDIDEMLTTAGWTMTPEMSAKFARPGDILDAKNTTLVDGADCFEAEAYREIRQHIANMLGIPENKIPKVSPLEASLS
jgi:hypothetical protein